PLRGRHAAGQADRPEHGRPLRIHGGVRQGSDHLPDAQEVLMEPKPRVGQVEMSINGTFSNPDSYLMTHEVGPNQNGIRLDAFLKDRYRKRSREALKRVIDSGAITVRRTQGPHLQVGRLKPSFQLIAGDEVLVLSERKPEPEVNFDYRV